MVIKTKNNSNNHSISNNVTSSLFNCKLFIPVIAYKVFKDLVDLNLLDDNCRQDLKILSTTPKYIKKSYLLHGSLSDHRMYFNNDYELLPPLNKNKYTILTTNTDIFNLDRDIVDFLFCFNHKKYVLDVEKLKNENLFSILKTHYKKKSILLLNDCIYISETQSLRGERLSRIICENPILDEISDILASFPGFDVETSSYKYFMSKDIIRKIPADGGENEKLEQYMEHLNALKKTAI
jgi:hypothetical protein